MEHKLIMEGWRDWVDNIKGAANEFAGDVYDEFMKPVDIAEVMSFAESEAEAQYPYSDYPNDYRRRHDQTHFQNGLRHILMSFMLQHRVDTQARAIGASLEVAQYFYKNAKDIYKKYAQDKDISDPSHDPNDAHADILNNEIGIALAKKYEKYVNLKNRDYVKIIKDAHMQSGDFWTNQTYGTGNILKYKDLLVARKEDKDKDPKTQVAPKPKDLKDL